MVIFHGFLYVYQRVYIVTFFCSFCLYTVSVIFTLYFFLGANKNVPIQFFLNTC